MDELKIRFNTENTDGILVWRILINGVEQLASDRVKWHITAKYNQLIWQGTKLIVI